MAIGISEEVQLRTCTGCGGTFPASREFFYTRIGNQLKSRCKTCSGREGTQRRRRRLGLPSDQTPRRYTRHNLPVSCTDENGKQNPVYYKSVQLKSTYGLSLDEFNAMRERQGYCCAICGEHENEITGRRGGLHVDHDHETGRIRGLLCWRCNLGLGNLQESPDVLSQAISYITTQEG